MKKTLTMILGLIVLSLNVTEAYAARADRRQVKQRARIHQGVASGQLTRSEAKELRQDHREIRRTKREMRADDGRLDKAERKELNSMQNDASKNIYEEKHDGEQR